MPILGERKQFCPQGHDTFVVGRLSNRACRQCTEDRTTIWRKNNPTKLQETRRYSKLKFFYGITKKEYETLLANQNSLCAICGEVEQKFKRALAVDHDHKTGKVRGLLCSSCNQGLGHFRDSLVLLKSAQNYLGEI
jgi:Recombination endonuclease VII